MHDPALVEPVLLRNHDLGGLKQLHFAFDLSSLLAFTHSPALGSALGALIEPKPITAVLADGEGPIFSGFDLRQVSFLECDSGGAAQTDTAGFLRRCFRHFPGDGLAG